MQELVSCIMATRDRPRFFRQALRYFLRQTYKRTELVVVDDGERSVEKLCSGAPRVRYIRLTRPTLTGTKLNIGIELARGAILQRLDDDDYYHPDFVKAAVAHLLAKGRERYVAAWDCFLVLLAGEKQVRYTGHGWRAGGTLCFSRELWERAPFRDIPTGMDSWFLQDHRHRVAPVEAQELYVLVRHGRNTWRAMHDGKAADDYFRRLPVYRKPLAALVDRRDCGFYERLAYQKRAATRDARD